MYRYQNWLQVQERLIRLLMVHNTDSISQDRQLHFAALVEANRSVRIVDQKIEVHPKVDTEDPLYCRVDGSKPIEALNSHCEIAYSVATNAYCCRCGLNCVERFWPVPHTLGRFEAAERLQCCRYFDS